MHICYCSPLLHPAMPISKRKENFLRESLDAIYVCQYAEGSEQLTVKPYVLSCKLQNEFTFFYQLDFTTPGISPLEANILKQIRQIPNFRRYALLRPQMGHLLYWRVENFCILCALAISDFLAKISSPSGFTLSGRCCASGSGSQSKKTEPAIRN